jgi:HEAT repeat protein
VIEQLKSPDAGKRAQAARELGRRGEPSVVPVLAAALSDSSEKVRREVVVALASLPAPEVLHRRGSIHRPYRLRATHLATG